MTTRSGPLLRAALAFQWGEIDPRRAANAGAIALLGHTHDTLTSTHPATGRCSPRLLAELPRMTGDGAFRLSVRTDLQFNDGRPLRPVDVATSLEEVVEDPGSVFATHLSTTSVRAVEGDSVLVRSSLRPSVLGRRLGLVRVRPADMLGTEEATVGCGAYRLRSLDAEVAVLEAVRTGSRHEALASVVELHGVVDGATRTDGLLDAYFDAVEDPSPALARAAPVGVEVARRASANTAWVLFNCSGTFSDPKHRRALSGLLDRTRCSAASDEPTRATWRLVPGLGTDEPGPPEQTGGRRRGGHLPAGPHRVFVSDVSWMTTIAEEAVDQLRAAGLDVVVDIGPTSTFFAGRAPAGEYDLAICSGDPFALLADPVFGLRWYLTGRWSSVYGHWDGAAAQALRDELDALDQVEPPGTSTRSAAHTPVDEDHVDRLGKLSDMIADQCPLTPLVRREQLTGWRTTLSGFNPRSVPGLLLCRSTPSIPG